MEECHSWKFPPPSATFQQALWLWTSAVIDKQHQVYDSNRAWLFLHLRSLLQPEPRRFCSLWPRSDQDFHIPVWTKLVMMEAEVLSSSSDAARQIEIITWVSIPCTSNRRIESVFGGLLQKTPCCLCPDKNQQLLFWILRLKFLSIQWIFTLRSLTGNMI